MVMLAKDIATTRRIELWAHEAVKLHKRECRNSPGCAARTYIWWITRHPHTHADVANQTAIDYVLSRQVCETMETRLVGRLPASGAAGGVVLGWLPGEKKLYRSRTAEERAQLLGREFIPSSTSESTSVEVTSFRSPEREFLEVPKDEKKPTRRRTAPHSEPIQGYRPQRAAVDETASVDWVDALTRRRD